MIFEGVAGAAFIGLTVLLSPVLRAWYSRWGATSDELERIYPGDDMVPYPKSELTCAITIDAPASAVYPWFVQLGCGRGGWYSYDLLDNGGVPSAATILPQYQQLKVGDLVSAVPNGSFGFPVAIIEPNVALSLAGTLNTRTGKPADPNEPGLDAFFSGDQTFFIHELGDGRSRLVFRMRAGWNPSLFNNLIYRGLVEPISFVMGRKMLMNVKPRAQALARQAHAVRPAFAPAE